LRAKHVEDMKQKLKALTVDRGRKSTRDSLVRPKQPINLRKEN